MTNKRIDISGEVEEDWVNLKQIILEARDQFVPKRLVGKRTWKGEFPPEADTFRLLKEKDKAYRKWLHNHNTEQGPQLRVKYNRLRNKVRDHTRKLRKDYEISIAGKAKAGNLKPFFSLARG